MSRLLPRISNSPRLQCNMSVLLLSSAQEEHSRQLSLQVAHLSTEYNRIVAEVEALKAR